MDEDLEARDVDTGEWLTFNLQTEGVNAAFKDEDENGGTPTYKIEVSERSRSSSKSVTTTPIAA